MNIEKTKKIAAEEKLYEPINGSSSGKGSTPDPTQIKIVQVASVHHYCYFSEPENNNEINLGKMRNGVWR